MIVGWNIFPWVAIVSIALSTVGAALALRKTTYNSVAMWFTVAAVGVLAAFIVALGITLHRPPMRTMGETRLWYSFFMFVAGPLPIAVGTTGGYCASRRLWLPCL